MSAIEFRDVTLNLAGRDVLADVKLDIARGEFIGLFGPNGAGKTTLMRAVLGLIPPKRGTIRVLGRPAARGNPAIGYMPQVRAIGGQPRLTGTEFVASVVNGHRLGLPFAGKKARAEVDRVLELVGVRLLAQRPLIELSGGERQRLLLAQALIGRPQLLLLDEPLANLDPHFQREVVALTAALRAELGVTVLFSAHDLNPLLGAMSQVLYLGRGRAALGTVEDVVNSEVLSRLYGTEIDVVHVKGRVFVMAGEEDVERDAHRQDQEPAFTRRRDRETA